MTKEERLAKSQACIEWIRARLQEGRDVYITTYTRSTRFRPRHLGRLDDYLRASSGGTLMARGKNWDCIDGCKISAI